MHTIVIAHLHQKYTMWVPREMLLKQLSNLCNFHSLEVVDRVSETQLQVSGNSN